MYANLLKEIWHCVYDAKQDAKEIIEKYFHVDFEQCINGVGMERLSYLQHVIEQRKNMVIHDIDYKHIIEKNNELFALYYPKGRNMSNDPVEAEVIAYFHFENQQLYRIHGQVRLLKGSLSDADMK